MPKFSIIVPIYNVAPYLCECLDSVLAQTFTDWECLCVDDGSFDESGALLDEYIRKDSRFRVWHKGNGGVSSARNLGLAVAKGEWVLFLDGDDTFTLNALFELNKLLRIKTVDILKFAWRRVCTHSNQTDGDEKIESSYTYYDMSQLDDVKRVFKYFSLGGVLACCTCFRTQLIKSLTFKNISNGEDVLFGTEVICRAQSLAGTSKVLYNYLNRPMSAVNTRDIRHLISVIQMALFLVDVVTQFRHYYVIKGIFCYKLWGLLFGDGWSVLKELSDVRREEGRRLFSSAINTLCCDREIVPSFVRVSFFLVSKIGLQWGMLYLYRWGYLAHRKVLMSQGLRKTYFSMREYKRKVYRFLKMSSNFDRIAHN